MNTSRILIGFGAVCLLLSGCSLFADDNELALDDREFWSTSVVRNGEPFTLVAGTRVTVNFGEEELRASAGCNLIAGGFDIEGDRLVTEELSWTEMGCDPERQAQDEWLIKLLTSEPMITLVGNELELSNDELVVSLIDSKIANPDRSLVDTRWEVDGFLRGEAAMAIVTTSPADFLLSAAGTVSGADGCHPLLGQFSIDGDRVEFSNLGSVEDGPCANQEYAREFYASMGPVLTWSINGDKLTLVDAGGVGLTARAFEG